MKVSSKIIIILLTISLIWACLLLNLMCLTYFQEGSFLSLKTGISTQFILVYILGIFLSVSYLGLILFKNKHF